MGDLPTFERAIQSADSSMVHQLVESGAEIPGSILHSAAKLGEAAFIDDLLETHTNKLDVNNTDEFGRTPLFLAAENSHISTIKVLLKHNAKVDVVDHRERNALHYAADSLCEEACEIILEKASQLGCAAKIVNMQELYIGAEQCFLVRGRDKGQHAWHYVVVDRGLLNVFSEVITVGRVDVGEYGVIIASGWGQYPPQEVVESTRKRYDPRERIDTNLRPDITPFHYAIIRRKEDLALKMLEYGADPNLTDSFGLSAVHLAAMRGQLALLTQMETRGANMQAKDNKDRRPLDIAGANRHQNIGNYLRSPMCLAPTQNFVNEALKNTSNSLETQMLAAKRTQGEDVRSYIVKQLRDLESSIHDVLYLVGTTPVMQPEHSSEDTTDTMLPGSNQQITAR